MLSSLIKRTAVLRPSAGTRLLSTVTSPFRPAFYNGQPPAASLLSIIPSINSRFPMIKTPQSKVPAPSTNNIINNNSIVARILDPQHSVTGGAVEEIKVDSVMRKRRLKMKKHKLKKRRKAQRALRQKLGK